MAHRDPDCIFCKIVAGEIPSARVYEDERVLAFLDISPLQPGHTLVIPKDHHAQLADMPADTMADLGRVLPRIAKGVAEASGVDAYNILQSNGKVAGQEVFHVHFHVVPRRPGDELGFRWKHGAYDEGDMDAWRERIANAIA